MGFYDVDYSNAGADQVTPGIYEVFVHDYQITTAQTGNTVVSLFYTVRDDVSQPHQGAKIQYDSFVEVQASKWRWDTAAKAAGIPDGTSVGTAQDWANMMVNKDLKVKIEMGRPNNQGKTYPEVKSFYITEFPNQGRQMPQLEKAYGQQRMQNAANMVNQHGYQNVPQQQTLPGTNPVADNRSFTNGGFQPGVNITDDDLPF